VRYQKTTRTSTCKFCSKDFAVTGRGNFKICPECKADPPPPEPSYDIQAMHAARERLERSQYSGDVDNAPLRPDEGIVFWSSQPPARPAPTEKCPRCHTLMQCYGNLEGKIIPMNPPAEDATWACHVCKLRRRIRRDVSVLDDFRAVKQYELLA
jgi:hypothetical protein